MVIKTRSDKKDTICKCCGHECLMPQKLREHLKRKNPCKPLQKQKKVPIQKAIQAPEIKVQVESSSVNMSNKEKPHVVIPTLVLKLELEKEVSVLGKELDLGVEPYEANDLDGCKTLFHDFELNDLEVVHLPILKELESEGGSRPKTQLFRKGNNSKNLINKEFECLGEIKGHERSEKNLEFREQEELEQQLKEEL
ncbi:hypothetical protein RhiirC2_797722 [Rhizophagus irregularis]|uniref:Uncharacterized protein n=1 Tax=Rhizophagus irregularis TaxID=588596 RepID=A0A2N1M7J9_9GLOM|nr:hypothetical protein RhiirC2_797722 [Rhizophagus irregularis]